MPLTSLQDRTEWSADFKTSTKVPAGEVRYTGAVLSTFDKCERIMSDVWAQVFYARVWDAATKSVKVINLGADEFGLTLKATVDATPEVVEAAGRWSKAQALKAARRTARYENAAAVDRAVAAAKAVVTGREVEVVKGRKVPIGTTGVAFWVGNSGYGQSVGIALPNGTKVFTALTNVVAAQPDEYYTEPFQHRVNEYARTAVAPLAQAA